MGLIALLEEVNQRHPWSHNDHFGRWVVRQVAASGAREVLDVGCGTGNLIDRLRPRATVTGLEPDPVCAARAAGRFAGDPAVTVQRAGFADRDPDCRWDAIVLVAVLHHLPLTETLRELREALRPGGRLVVLGCHRESGPADTAFTLASLLANPIVGVLAHPRRALTLPAHMSAPTTAPAETLDEITGVAERELPGARIRRRLFWRYTLVYDQS